jgi:lipopolysaccharide exporter
MSDTLRNKTIHNIGYNSIVKIMQLFFNVSANIILTRTLLPSDYGIVGFAGIFISFLAQFGDFGIGSALIQKKEIDHTEIYTAFTIKVFLSLIIFSIAFTCAPLAVIFFDNLAIVPVLRVLAFSFILNVFSFLPNLLLTRDLDYKKLSYVNILSALLNSTIAVVLALNGFKYWSIVVAGISMTICTSALMNIFRPVRYRFVYDRDATRRLMVFGGNVFLAGFMVFLVFNADNFIIGAVSGATNLGYYSIAFNWASMASTMISSIVLSVLFPVLSKIQGDREKFKNSYLKVLQYISFGGVLVNMTLFVISRDFLVLVLGHNSDKWMPALSTLRILCFYGIARLLLEPIGSVVMALGRTDVLRKATLLVATIELAGLIPILNSFGIKGVAILVTFAYLSQYGIYYIFLRGELQVSLSELSKSVGPALLGIIPLVMVFIAGEIIIGISPLVLLTKLICCIGIYLITYGFANKWKLYEDIRRVACGYI